MCACVLSRSFPAPYLEIEVQIFQVSESYVKCVCLPTRFPYDNDYASFFSMEIPTTSFLVKMVKNKTKRKTLCFGIFFWMRIQIFHYSHLDLYVRNDLTDETPDLLQVHLELVPHGPMA